MSPTRMMGRVTCQDQGGSMRWALWWQRTTDRSRREIKYSSMLSIISIFTYSTNYEVWQPRCLKWSIIFVPHSSTSTLTREGNLSRRSKEGEEVANEWSNIMRCSPFYSYIRAGVHESAGVARVGFKNGLSKGIISDYLQNVSMSLMKALHDDSMGTIVWPKASEWRDMRGLVFGFPNFVACVDGTKQYCFRPKDAMRRDEKLSCHHHQFCYSVLV